MKLKVKRILTETYKDFPIKAKSVIFISLRKENKKKREFEESMSRKRMTR